MPFSVLPDAEGFYSLTKLQTQNPEDLLNEFLKICCGKEKASKAGMINLTRIVAAYAIVNKGTELERSIIEKRIEKLPAKYSPWVSRITFAFSAHVAAMDYFKEKKQFSEKKVRFREPEKSYSQIKYDRLNSLVFPAKFPLTDGNLVKLQKLLYVIANENLAGKKKPEVVALIAKYDFIKEGFSFTVNKFKGDSLFYISCNKPDEADHVEIMNEKDLRELIKDGSKVIKLQYSY